MSSSAVVRATCPGCRAALRVPAAWAAESFQCKKCGAVMRGKGSRVSGANPAPAPVLQPQPVAAAPMPVPQPVPMPAPVPAPNGYPPPNYAYPPGYAPPPAAVPPGYGYPQPVPVGAFPDPNAGMVFAPDADPNRPRKKYRRGSKFGTLIGFVVTVALLGGAGFAGYKYGLPLLEQLDKKPGDGETAATAPGEQTPTVATKKSALADAAKMFPRRMLVLNTTRYLYGNELTAGPPFQAADHATAVSKRLGFLLRVPMTADNNQVFILNDAGPKPERPMLKPIVQDAVAQFCATSRPQDRVVIYYGGHAVIVDDKAFLVPVEGELDVPDTLIPLDEFWAKVRDCKAQQKVVVFDVCRLNEDGDTPRPGSEPMSKELEAKLLAPPPGVQVVTTCAAGQNALEFRRIPQDANDAVGSLFWSTLRSQITGGKVKVDANPAPDAPLPVAAWVDAVSARMKVVAEATNKPVPTPKLAGTEGAAVAYSADEPPPPMFAFAAPPKGVADAELAAINTAITLPMLKGVRFDPATGMNVTAEEPIASVVPFLETVMKDYKPEGLTPDGKVADPEKFPVRAAALAAFDTVRTQWEAAGKKNNATGEGIGLRDRFIGETNDNVKKDVLREQETPAGIILELEERALMMDTLKDKLDAEPSKFWRATFLYALAQTKARLAFMHEYNYALGNIRTEALPERKADKGEMGLLLVSTEKMKSKRDIKEIGDAAKELFGQISTEHRGTPWAVRAKRAKVLALGLEWQPYTESAKPRGDE